jgi:toxin ParE1/3/4
MGTKRLELHPEALAEADSALLWYRERSARAARAFIAEIERALNRVAEVPQRWPLTKAGWRRYPLLKFPYSVVYQEMRDFILIVAVAHGRRRPGYWRGRMIQREL